MDLPKPSDFVRLFGFPDHISKRSGPRSFKDSNAKFGEGAIELEDGDFPAFWALEGNGPMVIILHNWRRSYLEHGQGNVRGERMAGTGCCCRTATAVEPATACRELIM